MKRIVMAVWFAASFAMGSAAPAALADGAPQSQQTVPTITPAELHGMIARKAYFYLLDVREPDEFAAGHIGGAVSMPLGTLPRTYTQIPKGMKLVVYCRSGVRSAKAVAFLRAHGYGLAVSVAGGYAAYSAAP